LKPKIVIDTVSLLSPLTGIGKYTYEVSSILKEINYFNIEYFYGYYSKELIELTTHQGVKNLKSIISKFPFIKKIAREILFISSRAFATDYDVYWQPNFIPNRGVKAKKIVTTIHDFSFFLHRDFHPQETLEYFDNSFYKNIYRSDMIITGSSYTKQEILDRLDFQEDKIRVIYHGVNHHLFKIYKDIELDFKLPPKFILSVGSIEPRKNLLGLLKAYNLLDKNIKNEYKLILVGFKGWENQEIMEIINQNRDSIRYLGFISNSDLAKVYNLATCFVYPSFYEGFGLPIVEAMACGTAVVSSNSSSLPEVGGDAVLYCNPHNINEIKQMIEKLLSDKSLREKMIKKGLKQAQLFSWDKSAKEHLEVFKEILINRSIF